MSGVTVGAADGCWLNLADWLLPRAEKSKLFEAVLGLNYASREAALSEIGAILHRATSELPRQGPWEENGARLGNSIRHQSPLATWHTMQKWYREVPELFVGLEQASPGARLLRDTSTSARNIKTWLKRYYRSTTSGCVSCLMASGARVSERY